MCLIAVAWQALPGTPLVIAANRDEFHARAATAAAPWDDAPQVFGGRDRVQGGGWLAVNAQARRLAAVTNVRRMVPPDPEAPSRGRLVADFARADTGVAGFLDALHDDAPRYAGFNLLLWDGAAMRFATNHPEPSVQPLSPGLHLVSNASLDTPWPKAERLRTAMTDWLALAEPRRTPEPLFEALADRRQAPDAALPDTGVGLAHERMLSPPFIVSPGYGTRASTVVMAHDDGGIDFIERRFDAEGTCVGETHEHL